MGDIIKRSKILLIFLYTAIFFSCSNEPKENLHPIVEVRYYNGKAMLYRHGEPYIIKGAAGTQHMDRVAAYGGNSIRTWSLHDADSILDTAHKLGLTVTLGLEIGRPSWGNDFSYWKFWEVDKKIEELRPIIKKYKDHPALLMWGVGNEVTEYGGGKRPVVFYIINKVAKMIKEVDPNHPAMTAVDVTMKPNRIISYKYVLSHIDILGFNAFNSFDKMYDNIYGKRGWGKAYMLSEWGSIGHWSVTDTEWGAPKELKNSEKRELMEKYWDRMEKDTSLFLGSYAFYWGSKHEATHTWFSLFSDDGAETESVHFLKNAWSGQNTQNKATQITDLFIETTQGSVSDNVYLTGNQGYSAYVNAFDYEEDSIFFRWEIRREEYYLLEPIDANFNMKYLIQENNGKKIKFQAPKEEGPYRIFVFAYDGQGNVASYNIPFYVLIK